MTETFYGQPVGPVPAPAAAPDLVSLVLTKETGKPFEIAGSNGKKTAVSWDGPSEASAIAEYQKLLPRVKP